MPVLISGTLRDGAGKPVQDCTIQLKAKKTSPTVVVEVISSTFTDADGHYSIEAEPGYYSVSLLREGCPPSVAGDIYVAPTDTPDTLNAFLDTPKDADLRPEVMKRFEEMINRVAALTVETEKDRERAEQAAQTAEQSKDAVALSATAAAESQRQAALSADAADVSARSAADNARQTAQDVLASSAGADSAAKSAQAATEQAELANTAADTAQKAQQAAGASAQSAAGSATRAEQARDEALTSRNEALKAAETAATDSATEAAGKVSEQLKVTVAADAQRAEAAMADAESAAAASRGYRDEARDIAENVAPGDASTTQKGLVRLSSETDSESEALAATSKAVKKVKDLTDQKAPLDSPALTGTPTAPTPETTAAGLEIATAAFVAAKVAQLVGSAPEALDTLKELADALGNNPNFATTITNMIVGKQPLDETLTNLSGKDVAGLLRYLGMNIQLRMGPLSIVGVDAYGNIPQQDGMVMTSIYIDPDNNAATEATFQPIQVKFGDSDWQDLKTLKPAGNLKQEVTDDNIQEN
ncbi:TPA: prophage tail fiber N-terminal domain-containing protein [Salmonella enterica subsp. salamae serovar 42:g,t:-]